MKKVKTQKGITLVALVITIVVLLLLAVVALGAVRDSGIISHSQGASDKYKAGKEEEELKLAVMEAMLAGNGKYDPANLEIPDGFTENPDGTILSDSGILFEVNATTGEVVNLGTEISGPEGGEGEDPVTPPEGGEGDTNTSPQWIAQGLEVANQQLNVKYGEIYTNSSDLNFGDTDLTGYAIRVNAGGRI